METVLHIAHQLPDIRVEKMMLAGKDIGFDVQVVAQKFSSFSFEELESCTVHLFDSGALDQFGFKRNSINQIKKIIDNVNPDIIHAHDIYNAYFTSQATHQRFVYDDHEFWSQAIANQEPSGKFIKKTRRTIGLFIRRKRIPTWEKKIIANNVVITVTDQIAEHHRKIGKEVFVIENFPHSKELMEPKQKKREEKQLVYIGKDLSSFGTKYRNTKGFLDIMQKNQDLVLKVIGDRNLKTHGNIISIGYIPHMKIIPEISDSSFGVLPWKPHENQAFFSPNKVYLYAHAGLHTIVPRTFTNHPLLSYSYFNRFEDIPDIVRAKPEYSSNEIIKHARAEIIFDKRYNILKKVYNSL